MFSFLLLRSMVPILRPRFDAPPPAESHFFRGSKTAFLRLQFLISILLSLSRVPAFSCIRYVLAADDDVDALSPNWTSVSQSVRAPLLLLFTLIAHSERQGPRPNLFMLMISRSVGVEFLDLNSLA